ncbi:MAG: PilZ domain-containing protein [Sphingopyxis sp.]|uniref:PilZ domain-containing protein n=1 Tax=Sphingopyxis sp. TaxID=1908224 RepID=UPI002ABBBBEE|nr:PilZ domain-containing protein [Sphingopyxis sp.]MDZ3833417.1 PilZ domain-containing protein [Sphingopyxis sp.]
MADMESRGPGWLDEKVTALSRGADRDSLFMQATLMLREGGAPITVRVRNLSVGGMLAETPARVPESAVVEIDLKNVGPVPGRIVWVGEGKFGIAFDQPVNPQAVRRQVVHKSDLPPHLRRTGLERGPFYRPR